MKVFIVLSLVLGINLSGYSQTQFILNKASSSLSILGTSSIHDWESNVEDFDIEILANTAEDFNINSLTFTADVASIKSGKRIMDRKTRGALKHGDYPTISFSFTELISTTPDSVQVLGMLSMAGVEQEISITGAVQSTDTFLTISGEKMLVMSDYGIDPPTAMMGSLKTGDEVTIKFNLNLDKQ